MANVCSDQSPWKNTDGKVVHAALWLSNNGIDILELTDGEVLSTYQEVRYPVLPDVYTAGDQPISFRNAGERI